MEDYPDQNKTDEAEQEPDRKLPKISNISGRRRLPDLPPPIIEASKESSARPSAETVNILDKPTEAAAEGAARFGKELIRQRQTARLEQEVTQLSQKAQDAKSEQRTIAEQQEAFRRELANRADAEKIGDTLAAKREQDRQNLRGRLSPTDTNTSNRLGLASAQIEKLKTLQEQPEKAPEAVLYTVEKAAEQDLPMEAAYERRHERKEERPTPPVEDDDEETEAESAPATQAVQTNDNTEEQVPDEIQETKEPQATYPVPSIPAKGLYRQAIRAGFWTALVLVALMMIFILLSRH